MLTLSATKLKLQMWLMDIKIEFLVMHEEVIQVEPSTAGMELLRVTTWLPSTKDHSTFRDPALFCEKSTWKDIMLSKSVQDF